MTSKRAIELLDLAAGTVGIPWEIGQAPTTDRSGWIFSKRLRDGSYQCERKGGLTQAEDGEVKRVWANMEPDTNWHQALVQIAHGTEQAAP